MPNQKYGADGYPVSRIKRGSPDDIARDSIKLTNHGKNHGSNDYVPIAKSFHLSGLQIAMEEVGRFKEVLRDLRGHLLNRNGLDVRVYDDLMIIVSVTRVRRKSLIICYETGDISIAETVRDMETVRSHVLLTPINLMQQIGTLDLLHVRNK